MRSFSIRRSLFAISTAIVSVLIIAKIQEFCFTKQEAPAGRAKSSRTDYHDEVNEQNKVYLNTSCDEMLSKELFHVTPMVVPSSPRKHFVFIKTHKTGSTYVMKILLRHIGKHSLKKPILAPYPFQGGYPGHVRGGLLFLRKDKSSVRQAQKGDDFVMVDHIRFNGTALKEILPKDTVYVSIVREPWDNFQSSYYYYYSRRGRNKPWKSNCFSQPYFLIAQGRQMNAAKFFMLAYEKLNSSIPWYFRSRNYQSHDLGLDPMLDDEMEIEKAVKNLESDIDLMMIAEYMDESVILLKSLLGMDWEDLISVFDKVNKKHYKSYDIRNNHTLYNKFRKFGKLDLALYEHFNKIFWEKVDAYGREKMRKAVEKLRELRNRNHSKTNNTTSAKPKTRKRSIKTQDTETSSHTFFAEQLYKQLYKHESERNILLHNIARDQPLLNAGQVSEIAEHMLNNAGGCPPGGI